MRRDTQLEPLSLENLRYALAHIRELIFDERDVFDDTGHLSQRLTEASIIFDAHTDTPIIDGLRHELNHLRTLVYKDELTGALNRRGVQEEFSALFKEAKFSNEHTGLRKGVIINDFSILFLDLDNFKSINDTHGHDVGDIALKNVVQALRTHVRDIDAVGRLGGEEFIVALLGASEDMAYKKAEEIRTHVESVLCGDDHTCTTVSIGVASLHASNAQTLDELITYADKAMYEAKTQRGKNATVRYSEVKNS
jgi:diguanylate cyclase (GGDEF)-like protein